jgi:hypothetical protein
LESYGVIKDTKYSNVPRNKETVVMSRHQELHHNKQHQHKAVVACLEECLEEISKLYNNSLKVVVFNQLHSL